MQTTTPTTTEPGLFDLPTTAYPTTCPVHVEPAEQITIADAIADVLADVLADEIAAAAETVIARRAFRVRGTTDDVTTCELCGRDELKGTIALEHLDADGTPTGEIVYYGSQCGSRAAGWTTRELRDAAKTADRERKAAEQARRNAEERAWCDARDAWIAANIGPDALDNPRRYGYSGPFRVVQAYRAATGA